MTNILKEHNISYKNATIYTIGYMIERVQQKEIQYYKYDIEELCTSDITMKLLCTRLTPFLQSFLRLQSNKTNLFYFGLIEKSSCETITIDFTIQLPVQDIQYALSVELNNLYNRLDNRTIEQNLILYIRQEDPPTSNGVFVYKDLWCTYCDINKPNILLCNCGHMYCCTDCIDPMTSINCKECNIDNHTIRVL